MSADRQVIRFEYQQSLSWDKGSGAQWSEAIQARVTITDFAISSGWLRENFTGRRGGSNDFMVLVTIVAHARPLLGDDLHYLVELGMATPQDEGRLYARVTDIGLGDELGLHRKTIAESAVRLAGMEFISILDIPEHLAYFRDSHGRYRGNKVYLLAGDLQARFLPKSLTFRTAADDRGTLTATVAPGAANSVADRGSLTAMVVGAENAALDDRGSLMATVMPPENLLLNDRGTLTATAEPPENRLSDDRGTLLATVEPPENRLPDHRGSLTATAAAESGATVAVKLPPPEATRLTNRGGEEEGEVFKSAENLDLAAIFARFAALRGSAYAPTPRDQAAVAALLAEGYTLAEILTGLDRSAARAGGSLQQARWFTFCLAEIRSLPPQAQPGQGGPLAPAPSRPSAPPDPAAGSPAPAPAAAPDVPERIPTVFDQAFGRPPTPAELYRLGWLHDELAGLPQFAGQDPWAGIEQALKTANPNARTPVAYVRRLLLRAAQEPDKGRKAARPPQSAPPDQPATQPGQTREITPHQPAADAPLQVGGLVLKPKPQRKSGYVVAHEESTDALYRVARRLGVGQELTDADE